MDAAETVPLLLTERMRKGTSTVHDKSDRLVNLKLGLVLTSRDLYGEAIALFAPIYQHIEDILYRQATHPQLGKLQPFLPTLRRSPGFEADLSFYLNPEQLASLKARQANGEPPELASYLARLDELEKDDPVLLLAYAYHMYMAIFAGGSQIRRMVTKSMGLTRGQEAGVRIFCFDDLGASTTSFRNDYSMSLCAQPDSTSCRSAALLNSMRLRCAACACRECYQHRDLPHRGRDCAGARRERPRVRAEQRAGSNRAEVRRVRRCVGGLHCMDDEGLRRDTGGRSGCVRLSAASGSVIGLFCGVTRSWRFRQRAAIQNTCRSSYKHCGGVVCTGCTLHCTSTQSRCR
jgi:heme oxygenase